MAAAQRARVQDIAAGRAAYPVTSRRLGAARLEEVARCLEIELRTNYRTVKVDR